MFNHLRPSRIKVHRCRIQYYMKQWSNGLILLWQTLTTAPKPADRNDEDNI